MRDVPIYACSFTSHHVCVASKVYCTQSCRRQYSNGCDRARSNVAANHEIFAVMLLALRCDRTANQPRSERERCVEWISWAIIECSFIVRFFSGMYSVLSRNRSRTWALPALCADMYERNGIENRFVSPWNSSSMPILIIDMSVVFIDRIIHFVEYLDVFDDIPLLTAYINCVAREMNMILPNGKPNVGRILDFLDRYSDADKLIIMRQAQPCQSFLKDKDVNSRYAKFFICSKQNDPEHFYFIYWIFVVNKPMLRRVNWKSRLLLSFFCCNHEVVCLFSSVIASNYCRTTAQEHGMNCTLSSDL